jgi:hypothetical protein
MWNYPLQLSRHTPNPQKLREENLRQVLKNDWEEFVDMLSDSASNLHRSAGEMRFDNIRGRKLGNPIKKDDQCSTKIPGQCIGWPRMRMRRCNKTLDDYTGRYFVILAASFHRSVTGGIPYAHPIAYQRD